MSAAVRAPAGLTTAGGSRPSTNLRASLVVVGVAAVLLAGCELALIRAAFPDLVWTLGLLTLVGLLYVFAGLWAWDRRPSNRMGLWLVVVGFLTLAARLSTVGDPVLATFGLMLAQTPISGVVLLMLLFPSGRFGSRLDRGIAVAAFVNTVGFAIPIGLMRSPDPTSAVRLGGRPDLVAALTTIQVVTWWLLLGLVVVILVQRLRSQRAVLGERRARAAVYLTGIGSVVLLPLVGLVGQAAGWSELAVFCWQVGLLAVVPIVFATSLLAGGYGRTGRLDELADWLGRADTDRWALRHALARTLGDESVQLLFRSRDGELIDETGRAVDEPAEGPTTGAVELALGDGASAVVVYDTAAVPDPRTVEAAGGVIAVALDRERLTAELLAERTELRRSRARLVEVGEGERRRLARDLHDGLQSRLVIAAIHAGTLAATPELPEAGKQAAQGLRTELEHSVQELRGVVHGLVPALLLERGLVPAAQDLVSRCGVPSRTRWPTGDVELPPAVAGSVYFVLAEAVTNVIKHARASSIEVTLDVLSSERSARLLLEVRDDGVGFAEGRSAAAGGLRGLNDRVAALGGRCSVSSRIGAGTTVRVEIPYDPRTTT